MELHFNLKSMFGVCLFLMLWQMLFAGVFGVFGVGIALYFGWLYKKKCLSVFDVVFGLSMGFNLWYVANLGINVRQYDYFNFFMHAVYFVENDFFVAQPIMYLKSVYFQPPLWGLIGGMVAKIGMLLGLSREEGFDALRYISLFSILGVYIVAFEFLKKFNFKKNIWLLGWSGFVFLPIHTILAGLNNNDALVYFLMVAIFAKGYEWYVNDDWKNSFIIAGLLAGAGMVKFSGLMMLSYLGVLGIIKLCKRENKKEPKLWGEFFVIGLGGVIGFAWGIFLLYFGLALVPPPQDVYFQDMQGVNIWDRLFDFSSFGSVFADVRHGVIEKNVWLSLVKTSVFGEWAWNGNGVEVLVYVMAILIALFVVFSFGSVLKYPLGIDFGLNAGVIVLLFAIFVSWALFWLEFPYFCSTEFRYVVGGILPAFLWMMNWFEQKNLPKSVGKIVASLIVCFGICWVIVVINTI